MKVEIYDRDNSYLLCFFRGHLKMLPIFWVTEQTLGSLINSHEQCQQKLKKKKSSFCEGKVYRGSISQNFEWITEVLGKFSDNKSSNETTF